jgi:hypothetical protein
MQAVTPRPTSAIFTRTKESLYDGAEAQSIRRAEAVDAEGFGERVTSRKTSADETRRSPVSIDGWINALDEEDSDFVVDEDASEADSESDEDEREEARRELRWLLRDQRKGGGGLSRSTAVATPPRSTQVDQSFRSQFWQTPPTISRSARRSISFNDATTESRASTSAKRKAKRKGTTPREEGERRRRRRGGRVTAGSRTSDKRHRDAFETGEWDGTISLGVLLLFMVLALASQAYALTEEPSARSS